MPPLRLRFSHAAPREVDEVARLVDEARARATMAKAVIVVQESRLEDSTSLLLVKARKLHYRTRVHDIPVSIENRKGSIRRGVDTDGKSWETKMSHGYGYFPRTRSTDGEGFDVFVGDDKTAENVYLITAQRPPAFAEPDEQKAMVYFKSLKRARRAFLDHYDDPRFMGSVIVMPVDEFKTKLKATMHNPGAIQAV